MSGAIGKSERETQDRVIALFKERLDYTYIGDFQKREGNSNIEDALLIKNLRARGFADGVIHRSVTQLKDAANNPQQDLYERNMAVYKLLRYSAKVRPSASEPHLNVNFIDWDNPLANDFAIAEEVTLDKSDSHTRRPDLVLYINGIALGVVELKNSRVSLGEGIRQLCSNQQPEFNAWFFSTVQLCFAGNDSEGLKYGTTGTPEKYYLRWKEDEADNAGYKLDKYLLKLCDKHRIIELLRDFILFDAGVKKVPRHNQYFGIKAAQDYVKRDDGGIIWHTQGSGKSITMILLARWILANDPEARVAVMTDRTKLDKQISDGFADAGETIHRAHSGRDLLTQLQKPAPRLLSSLVHKFGRRDVDDLDRFLEGLKNQPFPVHGKLFVFVDECHRTQSGKLHKIMKAMLPEAIFVGFTGTPLLKTDKKTSLEVFGKNIHTYKHDEAVEDKVVLDLVYEARDIDQRISDHGDIDAWFETKTKPLNDWQKNELKKRWATLREVLSSESRQTRIVKDIVFDFGMKARLSEGRGNAMLVASSIYEACRYYAMFQEGATGLRGKSAIVTSYDPIAGDISKEDIGANTQTEKEFVYQTYVDLLADVTASPGKSKTEIYEDIVTEKFVKHPAQMKLLIVVDKLLTGFDAPPCSVLYIDKSMQDHGLFQAICRTNRLDGEDKPFGHIVDYKSLFKKVEKAIAVYTAELAKDDDGGSQDIAMKSRLDHGRDKLDEAREAWALLCEPVEPPKGDLEFQHYFCGNTEIREEVAERAPLRIALYKTVASYFRSYANLSDDLENAEYSSADIKAMKAEIEEAVKLRDLIKNASGETLDLKPYEADMRFLIDSFIEAEKPRKISEFENIPLVDLIVKTGIANAIAEKFGQGSSRQSIAEAIESNIRSTLIREHLDDPSFYERMSSLLDEVIAFRRERAEEYEEYLKRIAELAEKMSKPDEGFPEGISSKGQRKLYEKLGKDAELTREVDRVLREDVPEGFKGYGPKEEMVKAKLFEVIGNVEEVQELFEHIKAEDEYG